MNEQTLSNPTTEDELTAAVNKAVSDGNMEEVDRLMAVELPEQPEVKEPEEPEPSIIPDEKEPKEPVKTEDESSEVVEEDKKGEAATKTDAAPTPADKKEDVPETDTIKALQAEVHRLKSDAGRVAYLQRKTQELERELRAKTLSRTTAPDGGDATPNNAKVEIPKSLQKRLTALKEIDPDLADTLEETITELRREQANHANAVVKEVTDFETQRADEEFLAQQYQQLVAEVPIAPQVFQSPEWKQWKESLSPARLAFAQSMYADEVKIAIQAFVQDMQARAQHTNGNVQVPGQPTTVTTSEGGDPTNNGTTEATNKVQQERERKMATAPKVNSSVAAKQGSVELDAEKQFSEFYKQIQKDNHLGGK